MIKGTGIDIVEISRFRKVLERSGERFILRVFTEEEQQFCRAHHDPVPHFAVRFAAKEALFKALGTGWAKGVAWRDAEVRRRHREAPVLLLHGEALRLSRAGGVGATHISLSHSQNWVVAMVVLE
ncbi:MAG TPA: holo-ACP synthase [Acidobacteriota bacterium]|nr:holo-ACP synthase [Acidobacteriota bacterium]